MTQPNPAPEAAVVLGQKYAFATASLILGIACYVNILGLEKAVLAIVFAWLALRPNPAPVLRDRRGWAKAGIVLGALVLVMVPTVLIVHFDRVRLLIEVLQKFQDAR